MHRSVKPDDLKKENVFLSLFWADPADQLRVDERWAVRQVAFRIFQPSCAARQLPGAGDRRDGR